LEFPDVLKRPLAKSAYALIDRRPAPLRQAVLDEIQMLASKRKVHRPIGLLHTLVERAGAGTFVASQQTRERIQERERGRTAQQSVAIRCDNGSTPVAATEFAQRRIAELKRKWR
jgi:hypothetical protein